MHPAFSVIVFSTLSGAGYGLIALIAFAMLTGTVPARALLALLALASLLVTAGLVSSLAHLGRPSRAWRAFSQWRTSWLSREGVVAVATYVPVLAMGAALLPQMLDADARVVAQPGNALGVAAALLAGVGAVATVMCTAMIYASLKPIPAWRHALVLPGYLLFALLTGAALLVAGIAVTGGDVRGWTALLAGAALAMAVLKQRYWHAIDRTALPFNRGDAVGLPDRSVGVFERPHTQGNYLTREMGFVVARRHARRLRAIALALFGAAPVLAALCVWAVPQAAALVLPLAAACTVAGALVERWLFFAQARHLVTLYY